VFLLEGGYDLQGLSEGVTDSFRALLGVRDLILALPTRVSDLSHGRRTIIDWHY
jgi:hypothetical protein